MIITLSWLKDHLITNANLEKIIDKLTSIGLEVEGIKESQSELSNFTHHEIDIRNRDESDKLIKEIKPDLIVHTAAQPSHDRAAAIPFDDFDTNAVGTLNLLEPTRKYCKDSPFVFMSTNKVYGDSPNEISLVENENFHWPN